MSDLVLMKIIFSRKGFDSSSGGYPSPIIGGVQVSLPIPTSNCSVTTYGDLGLGDLVQKVTRGRIPPSTLCHHDPMFENGRCAFGQTGSAQGHLANHNIGIDDVFLFFGLFSDLDGANPHHRIYGFLQVDGVATIGSCPGVVDQPTSFSKRHPHTIGEWNSNNTIYVGKGQVAVMSPNALRFSRSDGLVSHWRVPPWLKEVGLSFHGKASRWLAPDYLKTVGRGQEFITGDISGNEAALAWLDNTLSIICKNDVRMRLV